MFRFLGSVLGHAKLLTAAGVTASSLALVPVAAHAFQPADRSQASASDHQDDRTAPAAFNDHHEGQRGERDARNFGGRGHFENDRGYDRFQRRSFSECRDNRQGSFGGGHEEHPGFRGEHFRSSRY